MGLILRSITIFQNHNGDKLMSIKTNIDIKSDSREVAVLPIVLRHLRLCSRYDVKNKRAYI